MNFLARLYSCTKNKAQPSTIQTNNNIPDAAIPSDAATPSKPTGNGTKPPTLPRWNTPLMYAQHIAFYLAIALWVILFVPIMVVTLVLPQCFACAMSRVFCQGTVCFMQWFLGIQHRIQGLENLPKNGGYILACKHQSTWETLALMTLVRNPAFVLKAELMWVPLVGSILKKLGMISVARKAVAGVRTGKAVSSSAINIDPTASNDSPNVELAASVNPSNPAAQPTQSSFLQQAYQVACLQGRPLIIFPEGTRTSPGQSVRYRSGVALLAQYTGLPVVPVALNSGVFWPRRRFFKKAGIIDVVFLPVLSSDLPPRALISAVKTGIEAACDTLKQ